MPLWKFNYELTNGKNVTAICWSPVYFDMFAIGYGSLEFSKQTKGLICIYSFKNPSHPELAISTDSGVICLDFHHEHKSLLTVGCYDGSVMVFDIKDSRNGPIFRSCLESGKHDEAVWAVSWQQSQHSEEPIFYSASSDGRIGLWTLTKSAMLFEEAAKLRISQNQCQSLNPQKSELYSACSLHFNKEESYTYLIGTEEGSILWCSTSYNTEYLDIFSGHSLAVYSVKWNEIKPCIFLSASADWTVKLWDSTQPEQPIATFNLKAPVGDVAWLPGSATIFAAVTDEGKIYIFDVAQKRDQPMCEQKIFKKGKPTCLAFNSVHPVVLVGNEKGNVQSLKLSPNLRKVCYGETGKKEEKAKIERFMEIARKSKIKNEA